MIEKLGNIVKFITKYFSVWIILGVVAAFYQPEPFKPLAKYVPYCIMAVMLSMGLTVSLNDFKLVFSRPKDVFWGIVLRYMIMPFIALALTKVLDLPPVLAAGLILVGCCPSGTASNVMTFLAKGDTALSVTVSSFNTVLAPVLTPFMFLYLAGSIIPINTEALLLDIIKIVLVPVALGIGLRTLASDFVDKIMGVVPVVSVVMIVAVIATVIALSAAKLATVAVIAFGAVALHNAIGLGLGYGAAKTVGMGEKKSRAIAFEIGMENSGLAVALAIAHLDPVAAIPGAIFSVWHNLTGSLLAGFWGSKEPRS